jgi:hypothetical protein
MSSTQLDAATNQISPDAATLVSLPLPLAHRIFLALPVQARGRASCVCRAWRNILAEPSLWTRLDMADVRVEQRRFLAALLGRARGQLSQLEVSRQYVRLDELLPVLTANAGSLRELHLHTAYPADDDGYWGTEAVMAAAPLLQVLTAENAECTWEDAPSVLRAELLFAPLQMRGSLNVSFQSQGGMERFGPFAAALADATLQPALLGLSVRHADTAQPALMGALADAVVARRLGELMLESCTPPAAAPLARLLAEGSLTVLEISLTCEHLFDAAGAALVADALRVSSTLMKLNLCFTGLCDDMDAACAVLGALVGHPSLRELLIVAETTAKEDVSAFGSALAALIAADAPALKVLDCSSNFLIDAGLAPIVEALTLNHHLHELKLHTNYLSEAFARERLLPAVRANTTLRALDCLGYGETEPAAAAEAEELVRRRGLHD